MPCFEAHGFPAAIRRDFDGVGENPPVDLTATTKLASRQLGEPICFMREIFSNPLTPVQRGGLRAESWQGWNHSRGRDTAGTLRPRKPLRPSNGEGAEDGIDWVTGSTERPGRWFRAPRKWLREAQEYMGTRATCSGALRGTCSSPCPHCHRSQVRLSSCVSGPCPPASVPGVGGTRRDHGDIPPFHCLCRGDFRHTEDSGHDLTW